LHTRGFMKRPLLYFALSMMAGILISAISRSYFAAGIAAAASVFMVLTAGKRKKELSLLFVGMALFLMIGSFEYLLVRDINTGRFEAFSGKDVQIEGMVDSEPDSKDSRIQYVITVESIRCGEIKKATGGKLLLTTIKSDPPVMYAYGRRLAITGKLNLPRGRTNPGGFDYRQYLAQGGIYATVFAQEADIHQLEGEGGNPLKKAGLLLRNRIVDTIHQCLPREQAGLLSGMLIGYRENLSKEIQEQFSDAGLTHIMAVSGANIAFIIMPFALLFKRLRIGPKIANPVMMGVLILFVFITGFSPSVLRAVIMAIIILLGGMLYREADVLTSLAAAVILLLLYNPGMLFDIGFQLSFAATLSLVLFYKTLRAGLDFPHMPRFAAEILAVTLAAQLGVLPITLYHFNKLSLLSLLANLLVIPVVQIITLLGFGMVLAGQFSLFLARIAGYANHSFLSFILWVSETSSNIPFAVIHVPTPSLVMVTAYYSVLFFLLYIKPRYKVVIAPKHYLAAILILTAMIILPWFVPKKMTVVFLDVGEGDAIFIRTGSGKTVLIDGGGYSSKTGGQDTMGDSVVIPFLYDWGVTRLDLAVSTHGHDDHMQGLVSVLKSFPVEKLIMPENPGREEYRSLLKLATARDVSVSRCRTGDRVVVDAKTQLLVLHPQKEYFANDSPLNNESLVLKLQHGKIRMLFTGDIETATEDLLLEKGLDLRAEVLKIAHHGSAGSSGVQFLDAVKPAAAVISVGKNNFGHPSAVVLDRLSLGKVPVYRTDRDGAIIVTTDGTSIRIEKTTGIKNQF
jgi:competence protein ComEC